MFYGSSLDITWLKPSNVTFVVSSSLRIDLIVQWFVPFHLCVSTIHAFPWLFLSGLGEAGFIVLAKAVLPVELSLHFVSSQAHCVLFLPRLNRVTNIFSAKVKKPYVNLETIVPRSRHSLSFRTFSRLGSKQRLSWIFHLTSVSHSFT